MKSHDNAMDTVDSPAPVKPPRRKIGVRNQVYIPDKIMDALQLSQGDLVDFVVADKKIILHPQKVVPLA